MVDDRAGCSSLLMQSTVGGAEVGQLELSVAEAVVGTASLACFHGMTLVPYRNGGL